MATIQKKSADLRFQNIAPRTDTWWERPKGRTPPVTSTRKNMEELWKKWHPCPPEPKKMTRRELEASVERLHNSKMIYWNQLSSGLANFLDEDLNMLTPRIQSAPCTPRSISQDMLDRMVYRLYTVKTPEQTDRISSCQLRFRFERSAAGGLGKYVEEWIPSPRRTNRERMEALIKLSEKCKEKHQQTQMKLKEKYLQPLTISKKIKWTELHPKLQRMHEGRRWSRSDFN